MGTYRPEHEQRRTVQVTATVDLPEGIGAEPTAYDREKDRKAFRLTVVGIVVDGILAFFTLVAAGTALYVAALSQKAVGEAKRSADAAWEAIYSGDRPWVLIRDATLESPEGNNQNPNIRIARLPLNNAGRTPALDMRLLPQPGIYPQPSKDERGFLVGLSDTLVEAVNHSRVNFLVLPPGEAPLRFNYATDISKAERRPLGEVAISGLVAYRDTYNRPHRTAFCFLMIPNQSQYPATLCDGWAVTQMTD